MAQALAPEELSRRYRALYTAAVSDVLDQLGLRQQALPHTIMPLTLDTVVAGPAFTGQGYPASDVTNDDSETRIRMLESIKPGTVSVWSSAGHFGSAHWGEIMSNAARERGVHRRRGGRRPAGYAIRPADGVPRLLPVPVLGQLDRPVGDQRMDDPDHDRGHDDPSG
jgi:hypothetical protein